MKYVTILTKGGANMSFPVKDLDLKVDTETGSLVAYSFDVEGTRTSAIFLDIPSIAGVLAISDAPIQDDPVR